MGNLIAFRYSSFYDVPRAIVLRYKGRCFYLDSPFDEEADEYPDEYAVYLFPESMEAIAASASWDFEPASLAYVGALKINQVRFDKSKRRGLDATVLDRFLP